MHLNITVFVVAWLQVAADRRDMLSVWLYGRTAQFLSGVDFPRFAYSLYFIHPVTAGALSSASTNCMAQITLNHRPVRLQCRSRHQYLICLNDI